jgi:hypothetical protein
MAREAGFEAMRGHGLLPHVPEDLFIANVRVTEELKAFEALVRADEREACAKVCEDDALSIQYGQYGERSKYRALLATVIRARGKT